MSDKDFLNQFEKILMEEEYDCSIVESNETFPYDRLLVFLGVDEKERERILEVSVLKQEMGLNITPDQKNHEPDIYRVQFLIKFPFEVKPSASNQMTSLVCYLNKIVELPGFEVNEVNLDVFYRYVLMYGEKKFNKKLFTSLVGIMMLLTELFSVTLEKVSVGETTFNELLEEVISIAQSVNQPR